MSTQSKYYSRTTLRGVTELLRALNAVGVEIPAEFSSVHSAKWTGPNELTIWAYPDRKPTPAEWLKLNDEKADIFWQAYMGEYKRLDQVAENSPGKFWRGEE